MTTVSLKQPTRMVNWFEDVVDRDDIYLKCCDCSQRISRYGVIIKQGLCDEGKPGMLVSPNTHCIIKYGQYWRPVNASGACIDDCFCLSIEMINLYIENESRDVIEKRIKEMWSLQT